MITVAILFLLLITVLPLAVCITFIAGLWKIFEKAGVEGWKSLIPGYNTYVLTVDVAKINYWWFLIILCGIFVPGIGTMASIISIVNVNYSVARRFTDDDGEKILSCFFANIMFCVFGFGQNVYSNAKMSPNGFFQSEEERQNGEASKSAERDYKDASFTDKKEDVAGYCTNCGRTLRKGDKFCTNCGKEVVR